MMEQQYEKDGLTMLRYNEYLRKALPEKSVWERKDLGHFHNFVKLLGLYFGYLLYRLKITANALDVAGLLLSVLGFYFLSLSRFGAKVLPAVGILMIFFHVWLDFIDGPIAKATDNTSPVGHYFDNLGCDVDRFAMIVLLGYLTENNFFIFGNLFAAYVLLIFRLQTYSELKHLPFVKSLNIVYSHKLSFLGVRFMLWVLPVIFALYYFWLGFPAKIFGYVFSIAYCIVAILWLIICIPNYGKRGV